MKPDLRCYHHPEREAVNQCDRCGDYLCAWCVKEFREEHVCDTCLKWRTPNETLWKWGRAVVRVLLFAIALLIYIWLALLCN